MCAPCRDVVSAQMVALLSDSEKGVHLSPGNQIFLSEHARSMPETKLHYNIISRADGHQIVKKGKSVYSKESALRDDIWLVQQLSIHLQLGA